MKTGGITAAYAITDNTIDALRWSPDGKSILCAGSEGGVFLRDLATHRETVHRPFGQTFLRTIHAIDGGRSLVISGENRAAAIVDANTGNVRHRIADAGRWVGTAAQAPLAVGVTDRQLTIIDTQTGAARRIPFGQPTRWVSVAVSPDGGRLAIGSNVGDVEVWRTSDGARLAKLKGHAGDVYSMRFSPDGKTLATAGADRGIKLWDTRTLELQSTLTGHTAAIRSIDFSSDGKTLVSGGNDKTVRVWRSGR